MAIAAETGRGYTSAGSVHMKGFSIEARESSV